MSEETPGVGYHDPFRVGGIYLLRGGKLLRYQGPWGIYHERQMPTGHGLAFRAPSEGVSLPAVGYSADPSEVLRGPLDARDVPWLRERLQAEKARQLPCQETQLVLDELEKKVPP